MELRGERECQSCGTHWTYYETGAIECPDCGSVRSVSVGESAVHTDSEATLDLEAARSAVDQEPIGRVAEMAAEAGREYRQAAGFVAGGDLQPLDDAYLLAAELESAGSRLSRDLQVSDQAEHYFLGLLRASADGERPGPDAVPEDLRAARGLAVSRSVEDYRRDLRAYLDEVDADLAPALSVVRSHQKRLDALDGDVAPRTAERLVGAVRDVYAYLERDDEAALVRIDERLGDQP